VGALLKDVLLGRTVVLIAILAMVLAIAIVAVRRERS
jgi:hypothetical protein